MGSEDIQVVDEFNTILAEKVLIFSRTERV